VWRGFGKEKGKNKIKTGKKKTGRKKKRGKEKGKRKEMLVNKNKKNSCAQVLE